jgi:hypothetical protein
MRSVVRRIGSGSSVATVAEESVAVESAAWSEAGALEIRSSAHASGSQERRRVMAAVRLG